MNECAFKKFKIDMLSTENTKDSITKQIITRWLNSEEIRNNGIKQVSIIILHHGCNSMFYQASKTEWNNMYLESNAYNEGDITLSKMFFDDNDKLINNFVVKPWTLAALQAQQSEKWTIHVLDYLSTLYDDYRNSGGFSVGYLDPIRDNRVYFAFVMNTGGEPITRERISSLYKKMRELYLEILPYAVAAMMDRSFKNADKYKSLLHNIDNHHEVFKNLKQESSKFNNKGITCFV